MQDTGNILRFGYNWEPTFSVTMGETYARFLEGMRDKKLLGNICPKCKGLYVPARPFCDRCFVEITDWVETDGVVTLQTFTTTYVKFMGLPDPPIVTGIVKAENAITGFLHKIDGIPYNEPTELDEKVQIGMRLKPKWSENRVGDILDIEYFEPF